MGARKTKKLILCHNQSMRFNDFFVNIQQGQELFDYSGYSDLLFVFDQSAKHKACFLDLDTDKYSYEYGGAYITGYMAEGGNCYDLAFAAAFIMDHEGSSVADSELIKAPALSKISEFTKLITAGIPIPKSYGGQKIAIIRAVVTKRIKLSYPIVIKRADAERGRDNYMIFNENEIFDFFQDKDDSSIWVLQTLVPNDGFYRLNCYFGKPAYVIYRSLDDRPPEFERHKAHMYKPAGGINAKLLHMNEVPRDVLALAKRATKVVGRDFAGVDIVVNKNTHKAYVLEANYFPQIVTAESFRETRIKAFLEAMEEL